MFEMLKRHARMALAGAAAIGLLVTPAWGESAPTDAGAAPPAPATAEKVELPTTATPAIWKITKANGATITFMGSIHLLPPALTFMTPELEAAIAGADVTVTEVLSTELQSPELNAVVMAEGMYPTGTTLQSKMSAEDWAEFEKACAIVGVPAVALNQMKPWLASVTLSLLLAAKDGYAPTSGVEYVLDGAMGGDGKTRLAFETAIEQIGFFTDIEESVALAGLVEGARQLQTDTQMLNRMVVAWAAADVAALEELLVSAMDATPEMRKVLLDDRNARWVTRIQAEFMADDKDYFILVGAGHLVGEGSVIDLLRKAGITVEGP